VEISLGQMHLSQRRVRTWFFGECDGEFLGDVQGVLTLSIVEEHERVLKTWSKLLTHAQVFACARPVVPLQRDQSSTWVTDEQARPAVHNSHRKDPTWRA
jgi:hypothetical protein